MKVGDLVQWYTEHADRTTVDFGLVQQVMADQVFIVWQTETVMAGLAKGIQA